MINDSFVLVKNFHNFPYVFLHITLITHCGPTQPLQIKIWTNLNLHYPRMPPYKWYDMNNKSFGVLKKKNFKECSMNYFLKKFISHYGSIFAQGVMIRANLNLNYKRILTNHGFAVLKMIFKNVPMYFLCETQIPNCGPPLLWGVMIWTTSNIHYQRILSFNYDQSQLSCSCEEDFSYICLC